MYLTLDDGYCRAFVEAFSRKEDMPRPKLHSDEFILDTALGILLQKGPSAFTLSDVAEAVGISRAALIQRFKDKATLHLKVMERNTQEVRDDFAGASPEKGLDPLWARVVGGRGEGNDESAQQGRDDGVEQAFCE